MNYRVTIASQDQLLEIKDQWNGLAGRMHRPSVFCTWEWVSKWVEYFGQGYELVILLAYDMQNDLKGILPLANRRLKVEDGVFKARVLSYCGSLELCSDHIDIICEQDNLESCLNSMMGFLLSEYRKWDVINMSHIPEDSQLLKWLDKNSAKYRYDLKAVSEALYIDTNKTFNEYTSLMNGNKRRDLNRLRRVLFEKSRVVYEKYEPSTHEDGMKILFELHKRRADSKNIDTLFKGSKLLAFHEDIAKAFYHNGWLRFRFLKKDDDVIAANYCFEFERRFFGYQQGIDLEWEKKSVGNIAIFELIKEACSGDIIEFDLLRGGGRHKAIWKANSRKLINANIYNSTFTGTALKLSYGVRNSLVHTLRKLLK